MPNPRRKTCQVCGGHTSHVGPISWTGKCVDCGRRRYIESMDQQHEHGGEIFERWRRRMAASVGGVLVDDLLPDE